MYDFTVDLSMVKIYITRITRPVYFNLLNSHIHESVIVNIYYSIDTNAEKSI